MRRRWSIALGAILLGGCDGGAAANPDANVDGRPDAFVADAGRCGDLVLFTAELIDLDSTETDFAGVFDARFTWQGDPALTETTAPNGRIEMCVPRADVFPFDVDAPASYLDGVAVVDEDAWFSSGFGYAPIRLRTFTAARAATFYAERGLTYDPARAHVLVYQTLDLVELSLDRPHDAAQAANPDLANPGAFTWMIGQTGRYVLFPNVDVAQPSALLAGSGPDLVVPLTAGELALVAVYFAFI